MAASRGKFGSQSVWFLCDGYNLIANKLTGLTAKVESTNEDTTGLGDSWAESTPTGLVKATVVQTGGFFDTTALYSHAALSGSVPTSPQATQRILCLGFSGQTIGESFIGFQGAYTSAYDVLGTVGALTKASAEHTISGRAEPGDIVHALTAKTADWNTKTDTTQLDYTVSVTQTTRGITNASVANPTVVTSVAHGLTSGDIILISGSNSSPTIDGSRVATVTGTDTFTVPVNVTVQGTAGSWVRANSTSGAVGYQQVTAFSGFSGFVGKLRDSADDTTYADLISFANVTSAPAVERQAVAGTIDRYMSYDGNITGSGSITVFCGIARL